MNYLSKEIIEKFLYLHPAITGYSIFISSLIIVLFLSVFAGKKLFKALISRNKYLSWILSFVWYSLVFLYFFAFFITLPKVFSDFFQIEEYYFNRMEYTLKDVYFISFSILFFLIGIIWLVFSFKKEKKISSSQSSFLHSLWSGTKISLLFIFISLLIFLTFRIPYLNRKESAQKQIEKIHNSKITLDDVMGKNLPPKPDPKLNNSTLQGIDANKNGIRDDIELAIFKKYPNSAKIRAALLQYVKALQMEMTMDPENSEIVTAVAKKTSAADHCLVLIFPRPNKSLEQFTQKEVSDFIEKFSSLRQFIEDNQYNTSGRKERHKIFYRKLQSYTLPKCDIGFDLNSLPN